MPHQRAALVVEDFPLIAADAEEMLNTLGFAEVVLVRSIGSALDLVAQRQFDFALLSMMVDDGKIDPVAEALELGKVPFLLVSDLPDGRDRPLGMRDVPYVTKPYCFMDLATALAGFERFGVRPPFPFRTLAGRSGEV
jgi:DNA-binding response OmpR family regulator